MLQMRQFPHDVLYVVTAQRNRRHLKKFGRRGERRGALDQHTTLLEAIRKRATHFPGRDTWPDVRFALGSSDLRQWWSFWSKESFHTTPKKAAADRICGPVKPVPICTWRPTRVVNWLYVCTKQTSSFANAPRLARYASATPGQVTTSPSSDQTPNGVLPRSSRIKARTDIYVR